MITFQFSQNLISENKMLEIKITDIFARPIVGEKVISNALSLNSSNCAIGMYIISIIGKKMYLKNIKSSNNN